MREEEKRVMGKREDRGECGEDKARAVGVAGRGSAAGKD